MGAMRQKEEESKMLDTRICRKIAVIFAWSLSAAAVASAAELFGTNTSPCPSHCTPASPWWGYVQTHWTRWPGALYPDMVQAPATTGEGISAPGIELPNPRKETDIRTVPSTTNNKSTEAGAATEPTPAEPATEPTPAQPMPGTQPTPEVEPSPSNEPAAPSTKLLPETKPNALPPLKEAPGAMPPADNNPFFVPPSNPQPSPSTPPGGSSMTPKPMFHTPSTKSVSTASNAHALSGLSVAKSDATSAAKPLRLRIDVDDFTRPISPDQEPELIVPSLASRPLATVNLDTASPRTPASNTSGNPLRTDLGVGTVVNTNLINSDSTRNDPNAYGIIKTQSLSAATTATSSATGNTSANTSSAYANAANSAGNFVGTHSSSQTNPLR
jgi:hypothetical protein